MSGSRRIIVVTGSNKGVGFATVKALCQAVGNEGLVYLTARSAERGAAAVKELEKEGLKPKFHCLAVDDASSIKQFAEYLKKEHGGLDVLVNNAGMAYSNAATEPVGEQAENTVKINYFGLQAVCKALFPLLRSHARVVNVSSTVGHLSRVPGKELRDKLSSESLTEQELDQLMRDFVKAAKKGTHQNMGWQNSTYSVSKVGVSALTRIQQKEFDADSSRVDILINHCHPGWVVTDMSSKQGVLTPDQGAVASTYLALLPKNASGPRGEYVWHDKQIIDWVKGPIPEPGY